MFLIGACTNGNERKIGDQTSDHSNVREVYIQPNKKMSLHTKDFIASVQYIPLETTDESEFGDISQIQIVGDYYLILDKLANEILFFRKNGDFVKKISAKNEDIPLPFKRISNFTVDTKSEILSFPDASAPLVYEFDLLGNFKKTRDKAPIDYTIHESFYLNKYKIDYFSYDHPISDNAQTPNITISENSRALKSYLYFDPASIDQEDVYGAEKYFFKSTGHLLFSRPYDYTIYSFEDTGEMNPYLQISLSQELRLPSDFLTSSKYINQRRAYTNTNKYIVYKITDVYKIHNILYFRLMGSKYIKALLYDLNTEALVDFRDYVSDVSTLYLPIAGRNVLGVDSNRLVSAMPASQLIRALNANISVEGYLSSLPDHLKEYYKKGNNQNPILVLTKLKESIQYETGN